MAWVLLVEDNALSRELTAAVLAEAGHQLSEARSAEQALALLRRGALPDLVLTDLRLPDQSGLELARQIRSDPELKRMPIVAITAQVGPDMREAALAVGCDGFLAKPVRPGELLAEVARVLAIRK